MENLRGRAALAALTALIFLAMGLRTDDAPALQIGMFVVAAANSALAAWLLLRAPRP